MGRERTVSTGIVASHIDDKVFHAFYVKMKESLENFDAFVLGVALRKPHL